MKQKDLPERWQLRLQNHLQEISSKYKELSFAAFENDLRITFGDQSNAFFYYAFYWIDEETKEIAVFTEHCGYHLFFLVDTKIETLNRKGKVIKTEDFISE